MPISIHSLADRPELAAGLWARELMAAWPAFMLEDPIASLYFSSGFLERFHRYVLVAVDDDQPGVVLARAFSAPFVFGGPGRERLPGGGWDTVVRWAHTDAVLDRRPNAVSAVEITVRPEAAGRGLATAMVAAMRHNAASLGFADLFAPVRPSRKHLEPDTPMAEYAGRTRPDGLPDDPWLRVHARAGATIVSVASCSMTIAGTLEQWRAWVPLPFDAAGPVVVPGALARVHVAPEHNYAVYVEPNVWMHHRLT